LSVFDRFSDRDARFVHDFDCSSDIVVLLTEWLEFLTLRVLGRWWGNDCLKFLPSSSCAGKLRKLFWVVLLKPPLIVKRLGL